ncbi:hypothetical protein ACLVWQ_28095 [Streptomyces sp. CWNU-52B]|uniref:hypothetical protein n=1 Tax=unclassified Streptomyces TaxID=2593676 RepID=UPI0039C0B83E
MSGRPSTTPRPGAGTGTGAGTGARPAPDATVSEVVRWAAFSCVLVPVVLVGYGASLAGAAGTALGLAAVTGACRALLRRSERGAARLRAEERTPHQEWHGGTGAGERRQGRYVGGNTPVD